MGNSLFDQLKKTGLVDDKKAKQAKKEKHKQVKQKKGGKGGAVDEIKLLAQRAQSEKVARDRDLNRQRKLAAEQKAIAAQIIQLVEMNRVEENDGEIAFNFTDGKNVQRVFVTERMRDQLVRGHLAIVKLDDTYNVVPAKVAEKIKLRDPACVLVCNVVAADDSGTDDPYADYKVPDDLMW